MGVELCSVKAGTVVQLSRPVEINQDVCNRVLAYLKMRLNLYNADKTGTREVGLSARGLVCGLQIEHECLIAHLSYLETVKRVYSIPQVKSWLNHIPFETRWFLSSHEVFIDGLGEGGFDIVDAVDNIDNKLDNYTKINNSTNINSNNRISWCQLGLWKPILEVLSPSFWRNSKEVSKLIKRESGIILTSMGVGCTIRALKKEGFVVSRPTPHRRATSLKNEYRRTTIGTKWLNEIACHLVEAGKVEGA